MDADRSQRIRAEGRPRRRWRNLAFAGFPVIVLMLFLEILLRIVGFRFSHTPILMTHTWGAPQIAAMNQNYQAEVLRLDPLLFWSLIPGARLDARTVNDLFLPNGPVAVPKPKGTFRILCLGDSCTALGPVSYPEHLQKRLDAIARPDRRFEVVNAGCFGYSSYQGLLQFRERLKDLKPDLVTVYYGWNDLYLIPGRADKDLRNRSSQPRAWVRLMHQSRIFQLMDKIVTGLRTAPRNRTLRVAPEDYQMNLEAIVALASERKSRALLITAPTSHAIGHVPPQFLELGHAESDVNLVERRRVYNGIVREVAQKDKAALFDLAEAFDRESKDQIMMADGVHPNIFGRWLVAQRLLEKLAEMGVVTAEDMQTIAKTYEPDSTGPHLLRSKIGIRSAPLRVSKGSRLPLSVEVENTGDTRWLAHCEPAYGQVRLGALLFDGAGKSVRELDSGNLPHDLPPGAAVQMSWSVGPIEQAGDYVLEVAPVAEFLAWFKDFGDVRTTCSLTVE